MKKALSLIAGVLSAASAIAGNKIVYYFNHPVDNSVSTGVNAVYLNNHLGDTLVAYINRAKYTIDVAVYNFTNAGSVGPSIAAAINAAYGRGVKIRWIYDAGQSNTGLPLLNTAIPRVGSPTSSAYTIMHDKFMVVDANSADPSDAIVWTGSANWNTQQFNYDYNNIVVVQDSALARAYRGQFNMMWGDTGMVYNATTSKFGQYKTDLGKHSFTIEGKHVELYFSPADGTNTHIVNALNTAGKDLYFGMYTFTEGTDGSAVTSHNSAGVYTAGIIDNSTVTSPGSEYPTLNSSLGSSMLKVYSGSDLYHNKYAIIDPSDKCSDPTVVTGSHNWTASANTKNDENALIIHSDTAANIYYQSFKADFASLGGTLSAVPGCVTSVLSVKSESGVSVHPNPSTGAVSIVCQLQQVGVVDIEIVDVLGKSVYSSRTTQKAGTYSITTTIATPGMYIVRAVVNNEMTITRLLIER